MKTMLIDYRVVSPCIASHSGDRDSRSECRRSMGYFKMLTSLQRQGKGGEICSRGRAIGGSAISHIIAIAYLKSNLRKWSNISSD